MKEYKLRLVADEREWESMFLRVPHPHLPQAWKYGEAKRRAEGWRPVRCVVERTGGSEPLALCQILERRKGSVPLVSRINRGPLFIDEKLPDEAKTAVLREFRRARRRLSGGVLLLAPACEAGEGTRQVLRRAGFYPRRANGWSSSWLDLREDESLLFERLSARWKRNLKNALKRTADCGAVVSCGSLDWLLQKHEENQNGRGFVGPSQALVRGLHDCDPGDFSIMTLNVGDEPVAVLVVVRFGAAAEYYLGWNGERGRKMNSGVALLWHAVLRMQREGVTWFDLGGYGGDPEAGFNELKKGMNGTDYALAGEWIGY